MSNTEDYLDRLLNSLDENKDAAEEMPFTESAGADIQMPWMGTADTMPPQMDMVEEIPPRMDFMQESPDADKQFIDSFEQEFLSGQDEDEFLRQFERELAEEEGDSFSANTEQLQDNSFFANAEQLQDDSLSAEEPLPDFMVDTMGEEINDLEEPFPETLEEPVTSEEMPDDLLHEDEKDVMDLLQSEGDFSDIGDFFGDGGADTAAMEDFSADFGDSSMDELSVDTDMPTEAAVAADEKAQDGKKQKKETAGFLKKLANTLFGEEDALTDAVAEQTSLPKDIENLSEDDLLLMELEGKEVQEQTESSEEESGETPEDVKARKKREKEEKKAKKKAENAEKKAAKAAEKAAKKAAKAAKKASKPKKPKEPDNTPPLPKKPVILCFVMTASFLALVFIGTGLLGYSSSMADAKEQYGQGEFEAAYQAVAGLTIKEKDYDIYEKYRIMGTVAGEYNSYQTFMEAGVYDMALDSLVRAVGRCGKYAQEAQAYGCGGELEKVRTKAADALAGFGITEERALEIYALKEREDYSIQLHTVLETSGYTAE